MSDLVGKAYFDPSGDGVVVLTGYSWDGGYRALLIRGSVGGQQVEDLRVLPFPSTRHNAAIQAIIDRLEKLKVKE